MGPDADSRQTLHQAGDIGLHASQIYQQGGRIQRSEGRPYLRLVHLCSPC
jgi:hypothetical protein